jgi:hypothetical protein
MEKDESFSKELQSLLNRYSKENNSNTPDFVLAGYIENCLTAWNVATQQRESFYGRDPRPSIKTAL